MCDGDGIADAKPLDSRAFDRARRNRATPRCTCRLADRARTPAIAARYPQVHLRSRADRAEGPVSARDAARSGLVAAYAGDVRTFASGGGAGHRAVAPAGCRL